jgi:single-stranded DNA-specific DHH superfamily exonuclease
MDVSAITEDFVREIRAFGPYGMGFSKPVFLFENVEARVERLGKDGKHLKFTAKDFSGKINAFSFGAFEAELSSKKKFDLLCEAEVESWRGRSGVVLTVRDVLV